MAEEEPSEETSDDSRNKAKKQVTVVDDPEVFHIRPDTVEVERQEKPKPAVSKPGVLPPEEISKIIQETEDVIRSCEEKVLSQKLHSAKLGFMLIRIAESLYDYEQCINQLERFLVNGDAVTAKYYINVCEGLPRYGDYLQALENVTDSSVPVQGLESPIAKVDLEHFVKEIQENAHTAGVIIRSFRVMNKSINEYMQEQRDIIQHVNKQIGIWLSLKNSVVDQLDVLRDKLYKISAYLDIVKSGESRISPPPNSSFSFGSSFGDSRMSSGNNSFTFRDSFDSN